MPTGGHGGHDNHAATTGPSCVPTRPLPHHSASSGRWRSSAGFSGAPPPDCSGEMAATQPGCTHHMVVSWHTGRHLCRLGGPAVCRAVAAPLSQSSVGSTSLQLQQAGTVVSGVSSVQASIPQRVAEDTAPSKQARQQWPQFGVPERVVHSLQISSLFWRGVGWGREEVWVCK